MSAKPSSFAQIAWATFLSLVITLFPMPKSVLAQTISQPVPINNTPVPVTGIVNATVNEPAKTAFSFSAGPLRGGGELSIVNRIPAGNRFVIENVSYFCQASSPTVLGFLTFRYAAALPGAAYFSVMSLQLPTAAYTTDASGRTFYLSGNWAGRVYADSTGIASGPDMALFASYEYTGSSAAYCWFYVNGYLVPIP